MDDKEFQNTAFNILTKKIFESIHEAEYRK